jgi:hypothetical protein
MYNPSAARAGDVTGVEEVHMPITIDDASGIAIIRCLHARYLLGDLRSRADLSNLRQNPQYCAALRTASIHEYRRMKRERRLYEDQLPKRRPYEPTVSSPLDQLVHRERVDQLHFLVRELPERERNIIQDVDLNGNSISKLSDERGESESSLRSLRHRALSRMRQRAHELEWT